MNEISFALCQKPVVGVLMWLSSMCVTNQALHDAYIDLGAPNVILSENIKIPVDEKYSLLLWLKSTGLSGDSVTDAPKTWATIVCGDGDHGIDGQGQNGKESGANMSLTVDLYTENER